MVNWKWKKFEDLTTNELYQILSLRQEVFAVEQNCVYQDADGADLYARHLCGWSDDQLAAYLRVLPENTRFKEVSFGRVVTSPKFRGKGLGRLLTGKSLELIESDFGKVPVRISAQAYLENFYEGFGFRKDSEKYLEDNIPHIEMLLK